MFRRQRRFVVADFGMRYHDAFHQFQAPSQSAALELGTWTARMYMDIEAAVKDVEMMTAGIFLRSQRDYKQQSRWKPYLACHYITQECGH